MVKQTRKHESIVKSVPTMTDEEKRKRIGQAYNVSYKFATRVFELFPGIIKAIVLFGSVQKATITPKSDIDILIIVDDTTLTPTQKFIDWYNLEVTKLIREIDPRFHVNTVTLSTFWENVKTGEPVVINVLRYGIGLIDTGFFEPLQALLRKGRIRPTDEAIWNALTRVPGHMIRATSRILGAVVDFYWIMIDSAHAALMKYGQVPPSPEHIAPMLKSTFVEKNLLHKKYLNYYNEIWKASKAIVHGEIMRVGGADYDRYRMMAEEFESKMKELVEKKK